MPIYSDFLHTYHLAIGSWEYCFSTVPINLQQDTIVMSLIMNGNSIFGGVLVSEKIWGGDHYKLLTAIYYYNIKIRKIF